MELTEQEKLIDLLYDIIADQSLEIKELKNKLRKYEPEDLTTDDDLV
jgi:uncharacterized coiled-coil protein SlyX